MADEEEGPRSYERDRLYKEVWAEPVRTVAERYGVSDVALAKTCRKLAVPLPGRGYWAKVRSGQKVKQIPLLPLPPGVRPTLRVVRPAARKGREPAKETAAHMAEETTEQAAIVVAQALRRPHPLVRDMKDAGATRNSPALSRLGISVSRASGDRALRIMDTLLKAFDSRGLLVEVKERSPSDRYLPYPLQRMDPSGTRVKVDGEWVAFGIEERSRVVIPEPREPPKHLRGAERERWTQWHRPVRGLEYNGVLVLCFRNVDYLNVRKEWKDGKRKKLEGQLNDVVAHLYLAAEALKQKRIEHEREERARLDREIRELEEQERRQEEEEKAKQLSGLLERWRLARDIREFVAEALRLGADPKVVLEWALGYADRIDPLQKLRDARPARQENGLGEGNAAQ